MSQTHRISGGLLVCHTIWEKCEWVIELDIHINFLNKTSYKECFGG